MVRRKDRLPTRRSLWILAGLLIVFGIAIVAFLRNGTSESGAYELQPDNADLVALGETVYAENCAACHGADLEGEPNWQRRKADGRLPAPPHDETGHTWHHPDELLVRLTKYGLPKMINGQPYETDMPAFEEVLSDEEIIASLSYVKSRWPRPVRDRHDQLNAR